MQKALAKEEGEKPRRPLESFFPEMKISSAGSAPSCTTTATAGDSGGILALVKNKDRLYTLQAFLPQETAQMTAHTICSVCDGIRNVSEEEAVAIGRVAQRLVDVGCPIARFGPKTKFGKLMAAYRKKSAPPQTPSPSPAAAPQQATPQPAQQPSFHLPPSLSTRGTFYC